MSGGTDTTTVENNSITGIPETYGGAQLSSAGIWVGNTTAADATGSDTSTISGNTVEGGFLGIVVGPNGSGAKTTISGNKVSGFERTGINAGSFTLGGDGITATISSNTVTGAGSGNSDVWAQNGIEIANGGTGSITGNTVSGMVYTAPSPATLDTEASGIIVFESSGVDVSGNTVIDSQVGIAVQTVGYSSDETNWVMTGDVVDGNTIGFDSSYSSPGVVSGETAGTWGIWPASFCNTCSVSATIDHNALNGTGSATGEVPSIGIQVGDTAAGGAAGSVKVTADYDLVTGWTDGIDDVGTTGNGAKFSSVANYDNLSGNTGVALGNFTGTNWGSLGNTGTVPEENLNAEYNWWGCSTGPTGPPSCATVSGSVVYSPWLLLPSWCAPLPSGYSSIPSPVVSLLCLLPPLTWPLLAIPNIP
jgi:hypothetical protein